MRKPLPARVVAGLSLLFTYLFFLPYLPPVRHVRIPYDLHGYHYPLTDYAFQALREGRFPEWDASMYCGISFAGNLQAALFYPPTWLLFAANLGRPAVSYQSMQDFMFAHIWLAFLLCFLWLRRKGLGDLACTLGAGIFAFSGYACLQLQHLGLVAGYAWMPLGLWGIDEAVERRSWRPLWKVAAASALCFLAGYTPTWVAFAVCLLAYAGWRWKALAGTAAALAVSLLLAMVQILPTLEITALKLHEDRYGSGVEWGPYLKSYLMPNFFNFNMGAEGTRGDEYFYLGAAAVVGLLWLVRSRRSEALPLLGMLAVVLLFASNPRNLVWEVLKHSKMAAEVFRDWYFLAGVTLAIAPLAALGLDAALKRKRGPLPPWLAWGAAALGALWCVRDLVLRSHGRLAIGWNSAVDAAVAALLCGLAVYLIPSQSGRARQALAAALLLLVATEYQVFGTGRRFNAAQGGFADYTPGRFPGLGDDTYAAIWANRHYRLGLDEAGIFPPDLRHYRLATPQGFDPFLTTQYAEVVKRVGKFRTDRELDLDPDNLEGLQMLGVRYFISAEGAPLFGRLSSSPHFRPVGKPDTVFRVFEFTGAQPPYGYLVAHPQRTVKLLGATPEQRVFQVNSPTPGWFGLTEQSFPGWEARVDGAVVRIERWEKAFQAVFVEGGAHRVEFRYRSRGLRIGAVVSLLSLLALVLVEVLPYKRDGLGSRGHP